MNYYLQFKDKKLGNNLKIIDALEILLLGLQLIDNGSLLFKLINNLFLDSKLCNKQFKNLA